MSERLPSKGESPHAHNLMRNMERRAHKDARRKVHVRKTNGGRIPRKRKKYVHRVERATYAGLIIKLTLHIAKKGHPQCLTRSHNYSMRLSKPTL